MNEGLIPNLKVLDPACKPEKTAHMSLKSFRTDKVDQINSLQLDLNKTSFSGARQAGPATLERNLVLLVNLSQPQS